MIIITDYSTTYIKVNNNWSEVFFLAKAGLSVKGQAGNVILTSSDNTAVTFKGSDITSPEFTTLDEFVVAMRVFIDNV